MQIDGKQRLTTIIGFIKDEISVANEGPQYSEGVDPIAGKFFSDLQKPEFSEWNKQLWNYNISVEYIDTINDKLIDSIFDRLNRNGEPLTGQELRNAKYYGSPLLNLVEELGGDSFWSERCKVLSGARMEDVEFMSELVFLLIVEDVQNGDQATLDKLYKKYAAKLDDDVVAQLKKKFSAVTKFMRGLDLNYGSYKIGGVSHLYGIFSFSFVCHTLDESPDRMKKKTREFYELWKKKKYDGLVEEYKKSMSSRTRDKGQRELRRNSLLVYCVENLSEKMDAAQ